jgi:hypothetical protein
MLDEGNKMSKRSALILAGLLACATPAVADRMLPAAMNALGCASRSAGAAIATESRGGFHANRPSWHMDAARNERSKPPTNLDNQELAGAVLQSAMAAAKSNELAMAAALNKRASALAARMQAVDALGPRGVAQHSVGNQNAKVRRPTS